MLKEYALESEWNTVGIRDCFEGGGRTYREKVFTNGEKWRICHFMLLVYLLFLHLWEITEKILYIIKTSDKNVNHCQLPIKDYVSQTTIMVIIFWDFLTLDQVFLSPQEKESKIISNKHGKCELPHELPNDFT